MKQKETKNVDIIDTLDKKITILDGIGPKRAELFAKLGIKNVGDLISFFPRTYQNRGNIHLLSDSDENITCSFMLTISSRPVSAMLKGRMVLTKFSAFDDSARATICFFNSRFVENVFEVGQTYRFWGKAKKEGARYIISSPIYEYYDGVKQLVPFSPVYPLTSGLSQSVISSALQSALSLVNADNDCDDEIVPTELQSRMNLVPWKQALCGIHFPESKEDIEDGKRYFSVRNALLFATALQISHRQLKSKPKINFNIVDMNPFLKIIPFDLTNAQKKAIDEISNDLVDGDEPMNRLLSGDVGSGKTIVAAAAIFICVRNGYQAALMAPTEILANQHYAKLKPLFDNLGFSSVLLTGSLTQKAKEIVRNEISEGKIDIVIGTHALVTDKTRFSRPGLVITDEQHRFGVSQRAVLGSNDEADVSPHVLVMSATPIPRTMALIMYGDLNISSLDELPPGRQEITTYTVDTSYKERLIDFIVKEAKSGNRTYIVCPSIEPPDEETIDNDFLPQSNNIASAVSVYEELSEILSSFGVNTALLHGKMSASEKKKVMDGFSVGHTDVLVSTTVIEVGVDVPEATIMIILNAERFGLAQLHQLRGRVGRGKKKSYCILVSDSKGENAKKRLEYMKSTSNGYKIAEFDLKLRGPGDYLPSNDNRVRQHGDFEMVQLSDTNDLKLIMDYVGNMLTEDSNLETHPKLKKAVENLYEADERMLQ